MIIENRPDYVRSWSDVVCYPQAIAALSRLRDWPGKVVVVTNQSVVGRGLLSLQEAQEINDRLIHEVTQRGGRIDAVFMCPHTPGDNCLCRKPRPGLLQQAARALDLNLEASIMIGDALSDIAAGRAAGVQRVALVCTGRGERQVQSPVAGKTTTFPVFPTLADALQQIVWHNGSSPRASLAS